MALACAWPSVLASLSRRRASAQIKLGVAGPITGGNAAFGAQLKNGAEQAVEDINAAGGILGQKIQLYVGDDAPIPSRASRSPTSSSATA